MSDPDRVPTPEGLTPARRVHVTHVSAAGAQNTIDVAAAEEPLDVRLHGKSFAVIMRTPGHDRELAVGFLCSERVIRVRTTSAPWSIAGTPTSRASITSWTCSFAAVRPHASTDSSSSDGNSSPTARAASAGAPRSTNLPRSIAPIGEGPAVPRGSGARASRSTARHSDDVRRDRRDSTAQRSSPPKVSSSSPPRMLAGITRLTRCSDGC